MLFLVKFLMFSIENWFPNPFFYFWSEKLFRMIQNRERSNTKSNFWDKVISFHFQTHSFALETHYQIVFLALERGRNSSSSNKMRTVSVRGTRIGSKGLDSRARMQKVGISAHNKKLVDWFSIQKWYYCNWTDDAMAEWCFQIGNGLPAVLNLLLLLD